MVSSTIIKLVVVALLLLQFHYISSNIIEFEKWGMDVIMWVQGMRSAPLDIVMRIGAAFGFEFFLVLVPLLAWWGEPKHQKLGVNLFILLLLILFCVSFLKASFTRPRPFVINSNIVDPSMADKIEFSYPSGHAWASTSFFFLAKTTRKTVYWFVAALMSAYTLFSRLYFGVHYPHDLAAGMTCGAILLLLFTFAENSLEKLFPDASSMTSSEPLPPAAASMTSSSEKKTLKSLTLFNKPNIAAVFLLVITLVANVTMDNDIKQKHQGVIFVPFCLLGFILCRPLMPQLLCTSVKLRVLRLVMGIPIIFSIFFLYKFGGAFRPVVAAISSVWLFSLAPHVFKKMGLVHPPLGHKVIEVKQD